MRAGAAVAALIAMIGCPQLSSGSTGPDSFFGTWLIDHARSHYSGGAVPEQMTVVIEAAPHGLAYRSEAKYPQGPLYTTHYVARLDKTPALVVGTNGYLAPVSLAQIDEVTIDAVYLSGLKKVASSRWSLSADYQELQVTTTSSNPRGEESVNVVTFRRAPQSTSGNEN
jgi:hypothetical protein